MRIAPAFRALCLYVSLCLPLPLALAACGEEGEEGYDTLQACYDEHHNGEALPVLEAIVVCCLDHPIVGVAPSCKNTEAECIAHVEAELDASVSASDIQAACTEYVALK
jgi:hypothetical protein